MLVFVPRAAPRFTIPTNLSIRRASSTFFRRTTAMAAPVYEIAVKGNPTDNVLGDCERTVYFRVISPSPFCSAPLPQQHSLDDAT
jgi:hypothetical protein